MNDANLNPDQAEEAADGTVKIDKTELENYKRDFKVLSNKLVSGRPLIHVYSDSQPNSSFELAENTLEDVFFAKINSII